ncbi:UNVERIFIED_CONTAM: zinc finger protein [Trichonephila clavipes]
MEGSNMQNGLLPPFGIISVEKSLHCSCTFAFSRSIKKKNMAVHIENRPFVCNICQKAYTWKENLSRHSRIHSGEGPNRCNICVKKFARRINLKMHELKHGKLTFFNNQDITFLKTDFLFS